MAPSCALDFDPVSEIPSLSDKVIVVTGGTAGLGRETMLAFAAHEPAQLIFTGRSQTSADKLIQEVKQRFPKTPIVFEVCDLASLAKVQQAAKNIVRRIDRLDIVMFNAGVMALPPSVTKDGYEIQFGTNHVGQALLAKHLIPLMEETARKTGDVRMVWNTSLGYKAHTKAGIYFDKVKSPQNDISPILGEWMRYGQSKLANLLYARAIAKHHPTITSVSIHPGTSATGLVSSLSFAQRALIYVTNIGRMIPAEQCAWNQEWAATAPLGDEKKQVESGKYYEPIGVKQVPAGEGANDELAEKLWAWTQTELEAHSR